MVRQQTPIGAVVPTDPAEAVAFWRQLIAATDWTPEQRAKSVADGLANDERLRLLRLAAIESEPDIPAVDETPARPIPKQRKKSADVSLPKNRPSPAVFQKVRLYLHDDVVPVVPVVEVETIPSIASHHIGAELARRASARMQHTPWSWTRRGSSRRYEGYRA